MFKSTWRKVDVRDKYVATWQDLLKAALEERPKLVRPLGPISYNIFVRHWSTDCSTLRIAGIGSDFRDLRTTFKDDNKHINTTSDFYEATNQRLQSHRLHAREELLFYKGFQTTRHVEPNGSVRHTVFYFAQKLLLPKFQYQQRQ